ncbi:hypothetical protein PUATCC27989T_01028 [Phytobacter ursingii]|nr:hypothetical protein PUATCC27989T_01028 [Phytobacter ursingii]
MLKLNKRKSILSHRLPFVGGKSKNGSGHSFWNVPSTGGFGGGCETGTALALIFLKNLEEEVRSGNNYCPSTLSNIVTEMMSIGFNDSINGQAVGFFSVIEDILLKLLRTNTISLSKTEQELLSQANNGLAYKEEKE